MDCSTTHTFWNSAAHQFRSPIFSRLQDSLRSAFWNNLARGLDVGPKPECRIGGSLARSEKRSSLMRHLTSSSFPRTPSADETLESLDRKSNQQRHNVAYDVITHSLQ